MEAVELQLLTEDHLLVDGRAEFAARFTLLYRGALLPREGHDGVHREGLDEPMISTVVWMAAVVVAHSLSVLALWLRLRWRVQQEHARRRYLVAIARALPEGSQVDEGRSDGTWLRLAIAHARHSDGEHG